MSRIANLLTLSLIAALALAWGWALTTAFAGESNPDTAGSNHAWSVQGQSDPNFLENASVTSNPSTVLANQRVTLSGNGFRAGTTISSISIGGKTISAGRINDGGSVAVDDSGRWSATVDLPLNSATTARGRVAIKATDSEGAYGRGEATIPPRRITIDPQTSRMGTIATVRGTGFPSKNDEGSSFDVKIFYRAAGYNQGNYRGILPDASGNFAVEITIPSSAEIPSTNTVGAMVYYDFNSHAAGVGATTTHSVPPASIALSPTSGAPGQYVDIKVEGVKPSMPARVFLGGFDVTLDLTPYTSRQGVAEFQFLIPNLSPGSFPVDVRVGEANARATFTVTAATPPSVVLSPTSGAPGHYVDIKVEGVKPSMPARVFLGGFDVTPVPTPYTSRQGTAEFDIRIPNLSPGSFPVEVRVGESNARATFTVTAATPPGVTLSPTSGAPGTVVTVIVEGVKPSVPVRVLVGGFDITYDPAPYTSRQGTAEFDIRIPSLSPGSFPVEVQTADSTISATFTVPAATPTPAPTATAATPTPTPAAPQLVIPGNEPPHLFIGRATLNGNAVGAGVSVQAYDGGKLIGATVTQAGGTFTIHVHRSAGVITFRVNNQAAAESWASWSSGQANHGFNLTAGGSRMEDNPSRLFAALPDLVRAFTFDNATKGWNFFDPLAAEVSTLTRFMPQHSYWLLVSRTTWLMLNGVERQLTCVEGNCWNLIVW